MEKLLQPAQYLKGVGPKVASILMKLGIFTVEDLLYYYPRDYIDRSNLKPISSLRPGEKAATVGRVLSFSVRRTSQGRRDFVLYLGDEEGEIECVWFNQPHLERVFKAGQTVVLYGEVVLFRGIQMKSPVYEVVKGESTELIHTGRIVPNYSLTANLSQKFLRGLIKRALDDLIGETREHLPRGILEKRKLLPLGEALTQIHFPLSSEDQMKARERLVFDEFFFLEVVLARMRNEHEALTKYMKLGIPQDVSRTFLKKLPFRLTEAQKRVIREIESDIRGPRPMNRLLQGDVGSGKTVVAIYACLRAVENGYQAAFMAPTEILAWQHFATIKRLTSGLGVRIFPLTGETEARERKEMSDVLGRGEPVLVVGTHALIQEGVGFGNLGLIVVDEQHRFGVRQRLALREKGVSPDTLVMTATPIPRTLALTLYGDLDISLLDEIPPGRKKILTKATSVENREKVYRFIGDKLSHGHKAYLVYPVIDETERTDLRAAVEMSGALKKNPLFKKTEIGLLHGRMKREDKDKVMEQFRTGKIKLLVSTTVVEVGIDVPDATIMAIEHPERYGLSQLHQLRGRVGRGETKSYCILIGEESSLGRLRILEESSDGFKIAEADLAMRGPGDILGTRQHGLPELRIASLTADFGILTEAKEDAFQLIEKDPALADSDHQILRKTLDRRIGQASKFADTA
ncbi:MAG: ATP-dependent DNA helicase RecG [Candidatus Eisenbacteria bacterium]|nr:ATP-dependent DNA helicase RecG [Candidatus Eisenbacteria bacterium]